MTSRREFIGQAFAIATMVVAADVQLDHTKRVPSSAHIRLPDAPRALDIRRKDDLEWYWRAADAINCDLAVTCNGIELKGVIAYDLDAKWVRTYLDAGMLPLLDHAEFAQIENGGANHSVNALIVGNIEAEWEVRQSSARDTGSRKR